MIVTSDSSGSKLYLNGYEVDTTTSTSKDEDFGINYRIGKDILHLQNGRILWSCLFLQ